MISALTLHVPGLTRHLHHNAAHEVPGCARDVQRRKVNHEPL